MFMNKIIVMVQFRAGNRIVILEMNGTFLFIFWDNSKPQENALAQFLEMN